MTSTRRQVYRFGDFLIDTAERQLRRADLVIPLSPDDYATLLVLVEHAGLLVDSHALALAAWPERFVDTERVSRSLYTVRKALGEMPDGRFYVETYSRRGSRFVGDVEQVL